MKVQGILSQCVFVILKWNAVVPIDISVAQSRIYHSDSFSWQVCKKPVCMSHLIVILQRKFFLSPSSVHSRCFGASEKSNHEPEHFINVCIYASICPQKRGGSSECLREMDQGYFLVLSDQLLILSSTLSHFSYARKKSRL